MGPPVTTPRRLLARALAFSLAASLPLLAADATWGVGLPAADLSHRLAALHWPFHAGTVTLSTLGAWLAFRTIGGPEPSLVVAALVGALFGAASIVAAPAALVVADAHGVAFWQFLGAMFAASGVVPFRTATKPAG